MTSADSDPSQHPRVDDIGSSTSVDELVGPGRFPLRVQPAAALRPGRSDARNLMVVWFLRKSFYWLLFLGIAIGTVVSMAREEDSEFGIDWKSPSSVESGLLSPWAPMVIAILLRFVVSWTALALAWPLATAHEVNLEPRTNVGSGIGRFFDRLNLARAFRSLRWTHHVRLVALGRLGPASRWVRKLDPLLDVVNITAGVLAFVVPVIAAAALAS